VECYDRTNSIHGWLTVTVWFVIFDDGTKLTLLNITATLVGLFYHMEPVIELSKCYHRCICHDALYWTLDILLWDIFILCHAGNFRDDRTDSNKRCFSWSINKYIAAAYCAMSLAIIRCHGRLMFCLISQHSSPKLLKHLWDRLIRNGGIRRRGVHWTVQIMTELMIRCIYDEIVMNGNTLAWYCPCHS